MVGGIGCVCVCVTETRQVLCVDKASFVLPGKKKRFGGFRNKLSHHHDNVFHFNVNTETQKMSILINYILDLTFITIFSCTNAIFIDCQFLKCKDCLLFIFISITNSKLINHPIKDKIV